MYPEIEALYGARKGQPEKKAIAEALMEWSGRTTKYPLREVEAINMSAQIVTALYYAGFEITCFSKPDAGQQDYVSTHRGQSPDHRPEPIC